MDRLSSCAVALGIAACAATSCGSSRTTGSPGSGEDASSATSASGSGSSSGLSAGPEGGADAGATVDALSDATVAVADAGDGAGALDATVADSGLPSSLPFILGADITWTQQDQAGGATFVDDGVTLPILRLLKNHGFNYVRLRTFVDPTQPAPNPAGGTFAPYSSQGFADLAHTVAFGQQIKAAGMGFLLDFHMSDYWADPGKQIKPAAWANDDLPTLTTALHDYTLNAIQQLVAAGARPDMVQVGNEITPGMELSPGTAFGPTSNWKQLGQLLNAGISAIRQVDPTITIMLHIDKGGDLDASVAYIDSAIANGVTFDVLGESCYVAFQGQPSGWKATFNGLAAAFPKLKFVMAEYNSDPADQTDTELRQANDVVFGLPNHQGLGTFFWEPTHHANDDNPGIFTVAGNVYTSISACMEQYDQMKAAYGL